MQLDSFGLPVGTTNRSRSRHRPESLLHHLHRSLLGSHLPRGWSLARTATAPASGHHHDHFVHCCGSPAHSATCRNRRPRQQYHGDPNSCSSGSGSGCRSQRQPLSGLSNLRYTHSSFFKVQFHPRAGTWHLTAVPSLCRAAHVSCDGREISFVIACDRAYQTADPV